MTANPLIREAVPADAPELARLNAAFNDVHESPEYLAERLANPQRVDISIVAELEQRLTGFANLRVVPRVFYTTPEAELTELYVEPDYRRRGIARALIRCAERLAAASGARELRILTGTDNLPALELYRIMGYGDDDLALRKELT